MGFLDKAKKMAEQAQAKLEEAQKQFNEGQQSSGQGPATEYDQHGRPIQREAPHGDPLTETPPAPPPAPGAAAPVPDPAAPPPAPVSDPAAPPRPDAQEEDPNHPSYAPPKMSSGDPLAG